MGKTIEFEYKGNTYTLEYTRKSIVQMESAGFVVGEVRNRPATSIPVMFEGAFIAHHRNINKRVVDEIFGMIRDKAGLLEKLMEMYYSTIDSLMDEPEDEGNGLEWKANF